MLLDREEYFWNTDRSSLSELNGHSLIIYPFVFTGHVHLSLKALEAEQVPWKAA